MQEIILSEEEEKFINLFRAASQEDKEVVKKLLEACPIEQEIQRRSS